MTIDDEEAVKPEGWLDEEPAEVEDPGARAGEGRRDGWGRKEGL